MAFKTQKYELVELVIPGTSGGQTGTRWNFPDLPKLRYTSLQAVETFNQNDIPTSPLLNTVVPNSVLQSAYIVFYLNERQDVYRVPLISLHRVQNSNADPFVRSLFEFVGQKVTWDKTYIELSAQPGNTSNLSFIFGVYYS
jgi:hypothetical protein